MPSAAIGTGKKRLGVNFFFVEPTQYGYYGLIQSSISLTNEDNILPMSCRGLPAACITRINWEMKLLQQANTTTSTNTLWTISANLKSNVAKNYDARRCYPFATPYKEQIAIRKGRGGGGKLQFVLVWHWQVSYY